MKTIAFVIDVLSNGGAERVVRMLANQFNNTGYNVIVIALKKSETPYVFDEQINVVTLDELSLSSRDQVKKRIAEKSFKTWRIIRKKVRKKLFGKTDSIALWEESRPYHYFEYTKKLKTVLPDEKDVCIFSFLIESQISVGLLKRNSRIKKVFCERNAPVREDCPKNLIQLRDKLYYSFNDAVFQTQEQKDYYDKLLPMGTIILNPLTDNLPNRYEGKRKKIIVDFCRLTKQKNLILLIDSFQMLLNDYPDYFLHIYGDGPEKQSLLNYINKNKLEDRVFIKSHVSDIHNSIGDYAMFVSTSDWEGLSNSMLEAMAIGLPTVCTDCDGGGARMMIQDHVNGLLVPKGDVQAVYQAMKEIIEDEELAEKLSINCSKLKEELSVDNIVKEWIKKI